MSGKETCLFCHRSTRESMELGRLYIKTRLGIIAHYHCLVFSTHLYQRGRPNEGIKGFLNIDIRNVLDKIKYQICTFCGKDSANIKCCHSNGCEKTFHLPCGLDNGALHQFFDNFQSYCPKHRLHQEVVASAVLPEQCSICLQGWSRKKKVTSPVKRFASITAERDGSACHRDEVLWSPCCKFTAAFHRQCIKRMAETSGYFFKCPCCCNQDIFTQTMQIHGIYVPQADPAWELERDAHVEMSQPPNITCSAKPCKCTNGPDFQRKNSLWEMAKCILCASEGIHKGCGELQTSIDNWQCISCSVVVAPGEIDNDTPLETRLSKIGTKRKADMPSTSRILTPPWVKKPSNPKVRDTISKGPSPNSVAATTVTRSSTATKEGESSKVIVHQENPVLINDTPINRLLCSAVFKVTKNGIKEIRSSECGFRAINEENNDEPWT